MIKLYQFPPIWGLPNASLFCMKLETYLRMTKIAYEPVHVGNPVKAPKGKLPYIIDGDKKIADSHLIIQYLKQKHGDILDAHLTPREKSVALAAQKMMEEYLYWIVVYSRWADEDFWPITQHAFFGHLNPVLRKLVCYKIHKYMLQQLHHHGIGRHSKAEIYQLGCECLDALSAMLSNQDYFLGGTPTSVDACLFATLENILKSPVASPLQKHAQTLRNLDDYCERMQIQFFPKTVE